MDKRSLADIARDKAECELELLRLEVRKRVQDIEKEREEIALLEKQGEDLRKLYDEYMDIGGK